MFVLNYLSNFVFLKTQRKRENTLVLFDDMYCQWEEITNSDGSPTKKENPISRRNGEYDYHL